MDTPRADNCGSGVRLSAFGFRVCRIHFPERRKPNSERRIDPAHFCKEPTYCAERFRRVRCGVRCARWRASAVMSSTTTTIQTIWNGKSLWIWMLPGDPQQPILTDGSIAELRDRLGEITPDSLLASVA